MDLRLNSLGARALALLGLASDEDSAPIVVAVTEGPAAPAPGPEEPADPPVPDDEETEMTDAEMAAQLDAARAEAGAAATQAANARWATALAHENAKGRTALAVKLLGKNMSAEDVIDALADAPAAAAATSLGQRMAGEPNPSVPADGSEGEEPKLSTTWLGDKIAARAATKKGN